MLNQDNLKKCEFLLRHYGPYCQLIMLLEETSELQQATCKIIREGGVEPVCTGNFREELTDTIIMIEQAIMMFGISKDEINLRAMEKLKRAIKRSGDYYGVSNKADYSSEAEDKEKFPADNEGRK